MSKKLTPTVSVVLTFYNNIDYVERAIDQVIAQTFKDYELIIVDDGSTDGTAQRILQRIADMSNVRTLLGDENVGVAISRNRAVAEARGRNVWFIDCDDIWAPETLERLMETKTRFDSDVAVCGAVRIANSQTREGKRLDGNLPGFYRGVDSARMLLIGGLRGYLWNKLFTREILLAHPFPPLKSQSDLYSMIDIVFSGASFAVREEVLYWHIERPGSITNSKIGSFDNLRTCVERVDHKTREMWPTELVDELAYFKQWSYRSTIVNTTIRLGVDSAELESRSRRMRGAATLTEILSFWKFSKREAAIAGAMKFAGSLYPYIYRMYLRVA